MRHISPPAVEKRLAGHIELRRKGGEFENITAGCEVKPTLPPVGQIGRNRGCDRKISHSVPHAEQLRAVNLVRRAIGSVLMADPMFSENAVAAGRMYRGGIYGETKTFGEVFLRIYLQSSIIIRDDARSFAQFTTMRHGPAPLGYGIWKGEQGKAK